MAAPGMAKVEISKRLVLINSASSVVTGILSISVIVWLQQYLLRRISPEEYSLLPILAAVMVFTPLVSVVLTGGIARYVTEAYARGDERRVTQIVSTMFPLLLAVAGLLLVAGGVFAWYVDRVLTIAPDRVWDARTMMALMMFTFAVGLLMAPFQVGLQTRQKLVLDNGIELGSQLLSFAILFLLIFGVSTRVIWVAVANAVMRLSGAFTRAVVSRRLMPSLRFRAREFRWRLVKELTAFGAWNCVGYVGAMIREAADPLILNKLGTAVDVTSFHIGSMADRQIRGLMMEGTGTLQPAMTAMYATGDKERLGNAYLRGGRLALWVSMFMAAPLIVFRHEVLQLYLRERYSLYIAATTVMALLLGTHMVLYASTVLHRVAVAMARVRAIMSIMLVSQLANLGLTLYFVGVVGMGPIGSALGTFVAAIVAGLVGYWPLGLRMLDLRLWRFFRETLWPGLLPAICGAVAWLGLRALVRPSTWLELGGCTMGGMIVYFGVLAMFCLQPADVNDLRRILARVGLLRRLT